MKPSSQNKLRLMSYNMEQFLIQNQLYYFNIK